MVKTPVRLTYYEITNKLPNFNKTQYEPVDKGKSYIPTTFVFCPFNAISCLSYFRWAQVVLLDIVANLNAKDDCEATTYVKNCHKSMKTLDTENIIGIAYSGHSFSLPYSSLTIKTLE